MSGLARLHFNARKADTRFLTACRMHGYADQWAAYKAHDAGAEWPEALEAAWRDMSEAFGAYYLARDGANGFLGGKGA